MSVDAGGGNTGHVEVLGVADVFHVVEPDAGADDGLVPERVGRAEAGREVLVLRLPQVVVHPEILGAPDRRDGPAEAQTGVRIGAVVALAHQRRIVGLRLVEAVVDRRDLHREVVPQRVGERRRQLVAQAGQQRQLVRHLPVVVDERVEDVADEFSLGDGQRDGRAGTAGRAGTRRRRSRRCCSPGSWCVFAWKAKMPRENWLPTSLKCCRSYSAPDADGVASLHPGQLVDELQRVVVDGERAVVGVTDVGEPGERDVSECPT